MFGLQYGPGSSVFSIFQVFSPEICNALFPSLFSVFSSQTYHHLRSWMDLVNSKNCFFPISKWPCKPLAVCLMVLNTSEMGEQVSALDSVNLRLSWRPSPQKREFKRLILTSASYFQLFFFPCNWIWSVSCLCQNKFLYFAFTPSVWWLQ